MFGDFFVSSHFKLERLNFKQLTDLIIETRKERTAQRLGLGKKANARATEQAESARVRHEQKKLDAIQNQDERIAQSNRLAEYTAQSSENNEAKLDRIQKDLEKFYKKRAFTRENQAREFDENDRVREEEQKKSELYTDDKREGKKQVVIDNDERRSGSNKLEQEYLDTTGAKRTDHKAKVEARKESLKKENEDHKQAYKESFANIDQTPVEPGIYSSSSKEDKTNRVEKARERSEANAESVGNPYEKNKEVKARKEKVFNDSRERKAPKDLLFEKTATRILEQLRERIDAAYERGDIKREENAAIKKSLQAHTAELRELGFSQRLRRYAPHINVEFHTTGIDKISLKLFHLLSELHTEDQAENRSNAIFGKRHRRADELQILDRIYTPLLEYVREHVDPEIKDLSELTPPAREAKDDGILQEPSESTLLYEKHIEDCIKQNIEYRESLQKEDLIVYLDDMETRHPKEESKEATDRSSPSSPFRNPNWVFNDIMTYLDDEEKMEAEKARNVEEQLSRTIERDDIFKQDLLKRMNAEKHQRDDLIAEQKRIALRKYYEELIEDQNKSAHEKAVELGQFINLFF